MKIRGKLYREDAFVHVSHRVDLYSLTADRYEPVGVENKIGTTGTIRTRKGTILSLDLLYRRTVYTSKDNPARRRGSVI